MRTPAESNTFRRLQIFSGVSPTPGGEENLSNWLEQAQLMIEECECSDREKPKRIMESVRGPALEIVQAIRFSDPNATPADYLQALEKAFGVFESGEDLYFAFRSLRQNLGEKLSAFLRRLEGVLSKVVQKGGLEPSHKDNLL